MKTELELRHLRVFAAVVDAGTHTRAARALGISQSTVSETLSALERTLGVELFRKAAKGTPALTPSGKVLLGYARRMFALSSELVGALADASTRVKATLVVSAVESIGASVLPSRLAALRARWPAVRVEVPSNPPADAWLGRGGCCAAATSTCATQGATTIRRCGSISKRPGFRRRACRRWAASRA